LDNAGVTADSKGLIKSLAGPAGQILADAEVRVAEWFNDEMDRATGVYKRHTQIWIACFGALAVVLTNADTIRMTRALWGQPSIRQAGVALAEKELASCTMDAKGISCPPTSMSEIQKLELPLGWGDSDFEPKETLQRYLWRTLGWVLSALAISLGAPFWFDLLKRIAPATRLTGPSPAPKRN
jgi:hypothetical protein